MELPGAIIFVNSDINQTLQNTLVTQLIIDQVWDGYSFDGYISNNPNYPALVHASNQRILVIRTDFSDVTNRNLADIALFVKGGLASIEHNKFGPPRQTYIFNRLTIYSLVQPGYSSNSVQVGTISVSTF